MDRQVLTTNLFETMDIAKRLMHGRMQVVIGDSKISHTQLELLFTIRHLQPVTSKQLAQTLQLTPGAISQLADELDKQLLIERKIDPNDRRRQALRISKQGMVLLKSIEKRRREVMEHVVEDLTDNELAIWLRIQQKIISEFQALHKTTKERTTI